MISKSFLKSSFIYTVIGSLPLATSLLLLPFYTNLLNESQFGLIAIYTSFSLLIQIIVNFGFDAAIGVHYYDFRDKKEQLTEYVGTVVTVLLLLGSAVTLILSAGGTRLFEVAFRDSQLNFFPYGFMSVVTAVFNSFFKTYTNLLINQQRPERFFWMNIINFFATIGITLAGLFMYPHSLIGPMWGRMLSGGAIFMVSLWLFIKEFGIKFNFTLLKGSLPFCGPLVIYFVMLWVLNYIDRYIINYFMEPSDVGIYDFAIKCTVMIDFLQMGLVNTIQPRIFAIWQERGPKEGIVEVNKYYSAFTAITVLLIPLTLVAVPFLVPIVVKQEEYYEAFKFLPLISLAYIFKGLINMYMAPLYFFKKTKSLPWIFFVNSAIQVLFSIILIKEFGLWGIVWSLLLIKPVQILLLFMESKKVMEFKFNRIKLIGLPLGYTILVIILESLPLNQFLKGFLELFFAVVIMYFVYRKEVRLVLKKLTSPKPKIASIPIEETDKIL